MFFRKAGISFCLLGLLLYCHAADKSLMLKPGDSVSIDVKANKHGTHTGIRMQKGTSYRIQATGKWRDAGFEPTDAEGFPPKNAAMRFARFLQPDPKENYMKLMVKVGGRHWPVGVSRTVHFNKNGTLILQPNDATFFFGNNSGVLHVTVTRID
jgi:hypothetical protein